MSDVQHPAYGMLRPVTDTASVLLCNNPGLLTLDGTNTWVSRGSANVSSSDGNSASNRARTWWLSSLLQR